MSIQSEITLLQNTKDELRTAIMEKGVTVEANDLFSTYPTRISQISMTPGDKDALLIGLVENSLTTFDIPVGTKELGNYALSGQRLTSVTIPNTVTVIGEMNFNAAQCAITIPSSVEYLGDYAFSSPAIQSLTFEATVPPRLGLNYVFGLTTTWPIYVPEESVQAYKTAWPQQASRIQKMPEPVVTKQIYVPVQSTSDVTTGKYILSKSTDALNASLIKQTTSNSNGINTAENVISLNNSYCHYGNGVGIVPRSEFADAATFDYDALTEKLYWVDSSDNDTKYYLTPYDSSNSYFRYSNHSTVPSTNITVGTATTSQDSVPFVTFMTPNSSYLGYSLNARRIGWFSNSAFVSPSTLFKLVDVAAVKTADVTLTDSTTGEIFEYYNTAAPMISGSDTYYYDGQIASVRINDNVTELGQNAFSESTHLTGVNIPESVTTIGSAVFYKCSGLTSITIPNSVTSIGQYAFEDCTALANVTIGTGIQSIADEAFGGYNYNTSNLTSVTVKATTPPTLGSFVFNDSMSGEIINPNLVIYVPAASVDAYKSAWSEYASRIQAIPS